MYIKYKNLMLNVIEESCLEKDCFSPKLCNWLDKNIKEYDEHYVCARRVLHGCPNKEILKND